MSKKERTLEDVLNEMNGDEWCCPERRVTIIDNSGNHQYTITKSGKNVTVTKKR